MVNEHNRMFKVMACKLKMKDVEVIISNVWLSCTDSAGLRSKMSYRLIKL